MSQLYKKDNYLDKTTEFLINREIIEYDMQSAGFNLLKEYELVSPDVIDSLDKLSKKMRQIHIGLLQKNNKELKKSLSKAFADARRRFFEANELTDEEVLSIKKDAIVVLRPCHVLEFGHITFSEKNKYSSYYYLDRYEFYYNKGEIDVKGINDTLLEKHADYMLSFLYQLFTLNETSTRDKVIRHIKDFSTLYKQRRLDAGFYRELNHQSMYKTTRQSRNMSIGYAEISEVTEDIDIRYNFNNFILPLISMMA